MTPRSVVLSAPAKINLFLEILGRRPDGYHRLSTIFQEISLADALTARADPALPSGEFRLECPGSDLPVGPDNLVLRAARAFPADRGPTDGCRFVLKKRIPVGAGLGGGSSDAAAALKAIWRLSGGAAGGFPRATFAPVARRLGADVPFFLAGGRAKAGGIGDRLTLFPDSKTPYWFVLVFPRVFVSTREVYERLRFPLTKRRTSLKLEKMLAAGRPSREWAPLIFNRLEEAVLDRVPAVREARAALVGAGCRTALMSGSGSSVFGVVDSSAHGRRVLRDLPRGKWDVWLVRSA